MIYFDIDSTNEAWCLYSQVVNSQRDAGSGEVVLYTLLVVEFVDKRRGFREFDEEETILDVRCVDTRVKSVNSNSSDFWWWRLVWLHCVVRSLFKSEGGLFLPTPPEEVDDRKEDVTDDLLTLTSLALLSESLNRWTVVTPAVVPLNTVVLLPLTIRDPLTMEAVPVVPWAVLVDFPAVIHKRARAVCVLRDVRSSGRL